MLSSSFEDVNDCAASHGDAVICLCCCGREWI